VLAYPTSTWIIAPEVVQQFGDLKRPETAIGTGLFLLERDEPNIKTVLTRNPDYYREGQLYVDGVEWLVITDESTGLAMYRTGQIDCGPGIDWAVRQQDLEARKQLIFDIQPLPPQGLIKEVSCPSPLMGEGSGGGGMAGDFCPIWGRRAASFTCGGEAWGRGHRAGNRQTG
jgi:ABC-type transport system substrate-binding protein